MIYLPPKFYFYFISTIVNESFIKNKQYARFKKCINIKTLRQDLMYQEVLG